MTVAMSSGLSPSRSNLNVTILSLCVCSWHSTTRSTLSESCRDKRDQQSPQASVCSPNHAAKLNTDGTICFCVWANTWKCLWVPCKAHGVYWVLDALVALLLNLSFISANLTHSFKESQVLWIETEASWRTEVKGQRYLTLLIRAYWLIKLNFRGIVPLWCAALIAPSVWTSSQLFSWRLFSRSSPIGPRSRHSNPRSRQRHNCKDTRLFLEKMTPRVISHFITYNIKIHKSKSSILHGPCC